MVVAGGGGVRSWQQKVEDCDGSFRRWRRAVVEVEATGVRYSSNGGLRIVAVIRVPNLKSENEQCGGSWR